MFSGHKCQEGQCTPADKGKRGYKCVCRTGYEGRFCENKSEFYIPLSNVAIVGKRTVVLESSECSPNFLMFAGTAVAALKWCFLPSLARPRCCYMIRPLCKQVWRMTAYLDLSSTARAAFIELLRSFLSTFLQYLQPAPKSYLTLDDVQILSFLIIISYIMSSHSFCDDSRPRFTAGYF